MAVRRVNGVANPRDGEGLRAKVAPGSRAVPAAVDAARAAVGASNEALGTVTIGPAASGALAGRVVQEAHAVRPVPAVLGAREIRLSQVVAAVVANAVLVDRVVLQVRVDPPVRVAPGVTLVVTVGMVAAGPVANEGLVGTVARVVKVPVPGTRTTAWTHNGSSPLELRGCLAT